MCVYGNLIFTDKSEIDSECHYWGTFYDGGGGGDFGSECFYKDDYLGSVIFEEEKWIWGTLISAEQLFGITVIWENVKFPEVQGSALLWTPLDGKPDYCWSLHILAKYVSGDNLG